MKRLAARMSGIAPFRVMALLARAKELEAQGRSVIHMEIGEPDFPTPKPVCEAGARALECGELFYTAALGLLTLREAIADFYGSRYGLSVSPARIVITPGSSGALLLAIGALVDPGAEVLVTDPGYPANRHFVRFLNGVAVNVPVGPDTHYQMSPELLEHYGAIARLRRSSPHPQIRPGRLFRRRSLHAWQHSQRRAAACSSWTRSTTASSTTATRTRRLRSSTMSSSSTASRSTST